ncbi:hypothetical protein SCP_1302810 [Sparassis crispa]|uniref:Uncharacterized protein n=1 Tax=Sparassis crispa TaxID=139825 RepID=A0A401H1Z0_9APHY|nr:hypothetical protein SCP_1302810 [Sparassis crispa]GBE88466.1 hypothetical protein SCP_1302810 [Sparassis crispa]
MDTILTFDTVISFKNPYLDIKAIIDNEEEEEEEEEQEEEEKKEEEELAELLTDVQHSQQARAFLDNACVSDDAVDAEAMAWSIMERDMVTRRAQWASQSGGAVISLAPDGIHLQATKDGFLSPWVCISCGTYKHDVPFVEL